MAFSKSLAALCVAKQNEINRRGLMGFPVDSNEDEENQKLLGQEIASLLDFAMYQSPTTGLLLPVDKNFPANMLYYFLVGDYEEHDMQLIRRYVKPGDRVLELGGGVGLTGSLLGKASGNPVSVCEPNAALHPYIERTFAANGVALNLFKAAVTAEHVQTNYVTFNVCKDYWWSSLVETANTNPVVVQAQRLSVLIAETQADTLLVDIEGYEVDLFSDIEALSSIKTVLVELHTPSIGTEASSNIITTLVQAGFILQDFGGHTFVFSRSRIQDEANPQPYFGPNGRWYS
jgi:FkbM family methyltransferase